MSYEDKFYAEIGVRIAMGEEIAPEAIAKAKKTVDLVREYEQRQDQAGRKKHQTMDDVLPPLDQYIAHRMKHGG